MKMLTTKDLSQARLKELLSYDPETGIFTRKVTVTYNAKAGDVARFVRDGYLIIAIDGNEYKTHRLAFLYMESYFPEEDVDHINRNKSDNRWSNLREASKQCNARNTGNKINNTSGVKGVSWHKQNKSWHSRITVNSKDIYLGIYKIFIDAVKVRWEAEKKYNYPNCCTTSTAFEYLKKHGGINAIP